MNIRRITYTAFFIALGIVLPQAVHMIGGPGVGSIFLPMHIPAIIAGMLLGPVSGMVVGMLSVVVGFTLGMPPMPIAPFMFIEIGVYGLVAGYLAKNRKVNLYLTLIITMLLGRLASLVSMNIAISLLGFKLPPVFGTVAIYTSGLPGIVIQLMIVPPVVYALRRFLKDESIY